MPFPDVGPGPANPLEQRRHGKRQPRMPCPRRRSLPRRRPRQLLIYPPGSGWKSHSPGQGRAGAGGGHPARAPELLVKLNLLHCLIRAECATLEPGLIIALLFPTSFPERLKSPFSPLLPLPPSLRPSSHGNKELLAHGGVCHSVPGGSWDKIQGVPGLVYPANLPCGGPGKLGASAQTLGRMQSKTNMFFCKKIPQPLPFQLGVSLRCRGLLLNVSCNLGPRRLTSV